MSVTLFVQDHAGDHNLEEEHANENVAMEAVARIRHSQGYWTTDRHDFRVFVPWHCIDFIRIEGTEKDEDA